MGPEDRAAPGPKKTSTGEILNRLTKYRQQHILDHVQRLSPEEKEVFSGGLAGLDLDLVFGLHRRFSQDSDSPPPPPEISPAPIIPLPRTGEERSRLREARRVGESMIGAGQVAVLIVAGGQGSRLGFSGPKGKFSISPVRGKSLFQLFAESVKALSLRLRARIPLLILTSRENDGETREFFESRRFWGLNREEVHFFTQGMLPTVTPEGKLILKDRLSLLTNPDGHGGSLKALYESGLCQRLKEGGFSEVFYCQVDNPLVKIADPAFLGCHRLEGAEVSTKVVRRQNLEEKVGIYGRIGGTPAVIEYSDFPGEEYRSLDEKGGIRYWAGNTAIHAISLAFVERLNRQGFALPYHRAVKEVEGLGPGGQGVRETGWKFETFVFDSIPLARKSCCLEVRREEEFAPVKNRSGVDSPETARQAMNRLFREWLAEAGAEAAPGARVEISPLFALDKEELAEKLKGRRLEVREDTYFG